MIKSEQKVGDIPESKEIYKTAIEMAWPSALEAVLVQLIASVDLIMVGGLGPSSIAAVGLTNQPKFILLAVILSLNIGVTAVVARRRGENDRDGANKTLRQAIVMCSIVAFFLSILGFSFAQPLLLFAGAKADVISSSVVYFRIICIGNFFTSISLTINAAQRGCGNTKISMKTNIVANLVNLLLNYLLIKGHFGFPALGVQGAAIATAVGNFVGFGMSVKSITYIHGFLDISKKKSWKLDKNTVMIIFSISSSALVEQIFMRVGFFMTTKLIADLGTVAFATHQICMNILNISFAFGDGLGIASSALIGQSLGARRTDMAIIYGKTLQRISASIGVIFIFVFYFGRVFLVAMFTNDQEIITMGSKILTIVALTSPIQTSQVVITGCLRGAGDTKFVAITSFLSIGLVRPGVTWLFCYPLGLGVFGAWIAFGTDQSLRLIINLSRFLKSEWTKIRV
jgi:putative MATE family efflux protein